MTGWKLLPQAPRCPRGHDAKPGGARPREWRSRRRLCLGRRGGRCALCLGRGPPGWHPGAWQTRFGLESNSTLHVASALLSSSLTKAAIKPRAALLTNAKLNVDSQQHKHMCMDLDKRSPHIRILGVRLWATGCRCVLWNVWLPGIARRRPQRGCYQCHAQPRSTRVGGGRR